MKLFKYLCVAALLGGFVPQAQAQIEKYEFDQAHTQILFFVDHLGFSKSQGEFHQVDGFFLFDRGTPENSQIDVSIPTDSIDMDNEKWNAHMKSKDFFNVEEFPVMTFKSTKVDVTGKDEANIFGDLTILGVTKPTAMVVKFNKADKHPFTGEYVSGFSAKTRIKRSDFGMNYGLPGVGNYVELRIEVEGIRKALGGTGVLND